MKKIKTASLVVSLLVLSICTVGCSVKFWDPTQVGRFKPVPAVNVILDSLGIAEETPAAWESGEEPKPADVVAYDTDYVFGPGDTVIISIFELFQEGVLYANRFVVTETGKISIPDVGVVNAAGLTEAQLEEEIKQILSPNILKEPSVSVALETSQSRMFSILGTGITRPGRYDIPRYDYRLADALAVAGGISQFNISYVYVSRPVTGEETPAEKAAPSAETPNTTTENVIPTTKPRDEMLDVIAPMAKRGRGAGNDIVITSTELATADELAEAALPEKLQSADSPSTSPTSDTRLSTSNSAAQGENQAPSNIAKEGRIEWIFQDGRWIPVQIGEPKPTQEPAKETAGQPRKSPAGKESTALNWEQIGPGGFQRRVIKIPADKLLGGDPRYNIVIRSGDNIHVPVDIIGEFCIIGNVNNQGFINITGRPITLKMAIAAAGGLGQLAWPKNCEVIRRVGKKREEIVMVDLDKIAMGEQPDFFIKPNDLVNVGTHPTARWRAVLRNAFSASYGFGLTYDRNFVYPPSAYGTASPLNIF